MQDSRVVLFRLCIWVFSVLNSLKPLVLPMAMFLSIGYLRMVGLTYPLCATSSQISGFSISLQLKHSVLKTNVINENR